MDELIPIGVTSFPAGGGGSESGGSIQTVNARDLHEFLRVGKDFSNWIKDRIEQYGFVDGRDYVTAEGLSTPNSASTKARPQRVIDYHLTIDMAKELSMVERNEKGKEARQYFIEREKISRDPIRALNDPKTLRVLLDTYSSKVLALEERVDELSPKAAALDRISTAEGMLCLMDAAKTLQERPHKVIQWMSSEKWIFKRPGSSWRAYQDKIQSGLLVHKSKTIDLPDGTEKVTTQVMVPPKGLAKLASMLGNGQTSLL